MNVRDVLDRRPDELTEVALNLDDRRRLETELPSFGEDIAWLLDLMTDFNISATTFEVDEEHDKSGLGVELKWMSGEEIGDEAIHAYPGQVVVSSRYFPVGVCLVGSEDPYFLRVRTGELVRVPHDAV